MVSVGPPAGNGTTSVMARVEKSCASARSTAAVSAHTAIELGRELQPYLRQIVRNAKEARIDACLAVRRRYALPVLLVGR
jgi:hypothetical protein